MCYNFINTKKGGISLNDNELLLALSDMMDSKLSTQLDPIKNDITDMKSDISGLKSDMVEVKSDIAGLKTDVSSLKSDMVEVKSDITDLKTDMVDVKDDISKINITLENEICPSLKLLAENYLPAAIRYENSNKEHEAMKNDIELLKKVVAEHSEKLKKIS